MSNSEKFLKTLSDLIENGILTSKDILNFAEKTYAKGNYEMIISTGAIKTSIIEELKKISELVKDNLYRIKIPSGSIYIVINLNLFAIYLE